MKKLSSKLMSWASIVEPQAEAQAHRISKLPFVWPYVVMMPDVHLGKGAAVGLGIPTVNAILPAAVGVDSGCGMMAVRTQWIKPDLEGKDLSELRLDIEEAIPLSAGNYNQRVARCAQPRVEELESMPGAGDAYDAAPNWPLQLGSLGSGNHFIEVTADELGRVWLFLHSGSRGAGNKLAMKHIKIAQQWCRDHHIKLEDPDLAYLEGDTPEFSDYIRCLRWSQHFALLNRDEMMSRVEFWISEWMGEPVQQAEVIRCHHNYTEEMPAELAMHHGKSGTGTVWLSRKGAIDASAGKLGLIPGSMGDLSYVVEGTGNASALWTAPHGAGRRRSRGAAKREFTFEDLEHMMTGIEWRPSSAFLDEHPQAYKPIKTVMADAAELVTTRHSFHQILNVKGH